MKYKFLAYIPVMAAALLSFSACSDSFLDRETDGSFITPDQLEESAKWNPKVLLGQTQVSPPHSFVGRQVVQIHKATSDRNL